MYDSKLNLINMVGRTPKYVFKKFKFIKVYLSLNSSGAFF